MPESPMERAFSALLRDEVRKLNVHLPKGRKSLKELLAEEDPTVPTLDGKKITMRKEALMQLAKIVPAELHEKLKLPFVIIRRMDLGKSVFVVSGDKLEEYTVKHVLGLSDRPFDQYLEDREPLFLYKPHVSELIRKFHSLVVLAFDVPREIRS